MKDTRFIKDRGGRCELCGCVRNLEIHHIIPTVCGGPDIEENKIVLCDVCHFKLTPKGLLTKIGMAKAAEQGRIPGRRPGSKIETNKSKEAKKIILKNNKDFGGSLSNEETWTLAGISKMTFYKYKKELKDKKQYGTI